MNVGVVSLSAERERDYERFVNAQPEALITYTLAYRDLLIDLLGCTAHYAVALRGDGIVGVMPLMSLQGELGTVLNSLPYFGSNGGALTEDAQARDALYAWYAAQTQTDGVVAATVIGNPLAPPPTTVHDHVDLRVAHVTALAGEGDAEARIWAAIAGSARRNVRKARRRGIEVAVENHSFDALQSLHRRSMAAIGAPVKSPEFFAAVPRHFRGGAGFDLYVARMDDEAVAAMLVFYCAKTVDYYVPAVSPEHRGEQPMAAILIRAMVDAAGCGRARWNWGGSWPSHHSLRRFKTKWAGVPSEYRYQTKLNDERVLHARSQDILAAYPGFYVVPFACLRSA